MCRTTCAPPGGSGSCNAVSANSSKSSFAARGRLRRLQRDPVGLHFHPPRQEVVERLHDEACGDEHEQSDGDGSRLVEPRRRATRATTKKIGSETSAYQARPFQMLALVVAVLVSDHDTNFLAIERRLEQGVPQHDAPAGPSPAANAFGASVRSPISCTLKSTPSCPVARGDAPRVGGERRVGVALVGNEIRRQERKQECRPGEHRGGGEPPTVAQRRRQSHRDQQPEADEQELCAEDEPASSAHSR